MAMNLFERQALSDAMIDETARLEQISRFWDVYFGRYPKPLRVKAGQADDNVIINLCRAVVDKSVSFLFGQDVRFELDEVEDTDVERWLRQCWRANHGMISLQKLALNGSVTGHAFAKIIPEQPYPRVVVLDPSSVRVFWAADDIDRIMRYTIQYSTLDYRTGRLMAFREQIERTDNGRWRILDEVSESGRNWTTRSDVIWAWPWPPIVDCQNLPNPNEFWGIGDLEDIVSLNCNVNSGMSQAQRTIRLHGNPKTWGRGFTASQLNVAADETLILPAADAELHNLEMQSDLAGNMAVVRQELDALYQVSRTPAIALGKLDSVGALSGVALHIMYQPLIEKTETKRRLYGELIVELSRRMLALGGFGDEHYTTIHWPELIPVDPLQEAQTALLYQQLGVSQDTLLSQLGFDPYLEEQKRQVRTADLGEAMLTAFERGDGVVEGEGS